jgi:DNA-binding NarL/FixJ family response regulator
MQLAIKETGPTHYEHKPLGLLWVESSYPVLSLGLERTLKTKARIHQGPTPPDEAPSAVIYCANGGDVASEVRRLKAAAPPDTPVLVMGSSVDLPLARSALRAEAGGFLHAAMSPEQVGRALSVALKGEIVVPRDLLKELLVEEPPVDLSSTLGPRKREVLELVTKGLSNAEVARHLYLSESTVKQHLRGAYKALGVKNRTEAARVFRRSDQSGPPTASPPAAPEEGQ